MSNLIRFLKKNVLAFDFLHSHRSTRQDKSMKVVVDKYSSVHLDTNNLRMSFIELFRT